MPDWRTMFDEKWIKAWDLGGKPWTGTITKVEAGVLENQREKRKDRKPIVWFKGWKKPLGLNKVNSKTIAAMFGNNTDDWVGKKVTLVPAKTSFGNEHDIDCIRIRPRTLAVKDDQPVPEVAPPADEAPAAPPPSEDVCDTGTCGTCGMCVDAATNERRQEAS